MSDGSTPLHEGRVRGSRLLFVIMPILPILNLGFQFAAEKVAQATTGTPFGPAWLLAVITQPWVGLIVALEIASFVLWMTVLSRLSVSAAFPLTAARYGLVIALGWFGFHEPIMALQLIGAACIAAGVFVIGGEEGKSHAPQQDGEHHKRPR